MTDLTLNSPGIEIFESEIVSTSPDQLTNPAGIVINSSWGPLNELTYVSNKKDLFKKFGLISSSTVGKTLASAESFLDYANGLYVVRSGPNTPVGTGVGSEYLSFAVDTGNAIQYNSEVLGSDTKSFIGQSIGRYFAGRYAGTAGNNLQVFVYSYEGAKQLLNGVAIDVYATSVLNQIITNLGVTKSNLLKYFNRIENDNSTIETQKWLFVVTENGNMPDPLYSKGRSSGIYIREFAFLDSQTSIRGNSNDLAYQDYFNSNFNLVTAARGVSIENEYGPLGMFDEDLGVWNQHFRTFSLNGGMDITDDHEALILSMGESYDLFIDDNLDLEYIIALPYENIDISKGGKITYPPSVEPLPEEDLYTWAICKAIYASIMSKRSITLFSVPKSMLGTVNSSESIVTYLNELPGLFIDYQDYSYSHIDSSWVYYKTSYTTSGVPMTVEIPICSMTAGLMSNTKLTTNIWSSSAGYSRGVYKEGTKLIHPIKKNDRDFYFPGSINPILQEKDSLILFGNKTFTPNKTGPLSRIEVRLLMIRVEKTISAFAKQFLFETNDSATRARFKYLTDQYLSGIKSSGGITDYKVVVDASNNTQDTISANRLIVNVAIKPVKSINFITLNFDIYNSNLVVGES